MYQLRTFFPFPICKKYFKNKKDLYRFLDHLIENVEDFRKDLPIKYLLKGKWKVKVDTEELIDSIEITEINMDNDTDFLATFPPEKEIDWDYINHYLKMDQFLMYSKTTLQ